MSFERELDEKTVFMTLEVQFERAMAMREAFKSLATACSDYAQAGKAAASGGHNMAELLKSMAAAQWIESDSSNFVDFIRFFLASCR